MSDRKHLYLWVPAITILVLDQVTKHLVRTVPSLQYIEIIPGWLAFNYTKNPGMALGMDWASTEVISVIAILATAGILIYILRTMQQAKPGYLLCMGLVLGGAFGNITDRLIMGYIGNYGGVLEGHVIDFIHFNLTIKGQPVFPYIFNVADIAISTAIISLLVFHNRILPTEEESAERLAQMAADEEIPTPESTEITTDPVVDRDLPHSSDRLSDDIDRVDRPDDRQQ
ncbi:MAG: signal peptidase II [Balneolaceae bacterium]|nr:signal peptidase II [Balneolaceae bacterium]